MNQDVDKNFLDKNQSYFDNQSIRCGVLDDHSLLYFPFAAYRIWRRRNQQAAELIAQYGKQVLLVTGRRSFTNSPHWPVLLAALAKAGVDWEQARVDNEPSPQLIDKIVRQFHSAGIAVVVGIGGGSVLDAAKAVTGLLPSGDSVMDYLEGVGPEKPYHGPAMPFIAVPTTAGTGSEATKNAVLSVRGHDGFKKSFRHELLVPEYALVDPDLLATCPPLQIAANAMDALTQLLESYVSIKANPFTDALAESGLQTVREGLFAWYAGENLPPQAAPKWLMRHYYLAFVWRKPDSVRCMVWLHRWVRFSRFRMAWCVAL